MAWLLVRHRIADYAKWKPVFDESRPERTALGSGKGLILRSADDPNEILVALEVADVNKAREFIRSEDLRATMERAGVLDQPTVFLLEVVEELSG